MDADISKKIYCYVCRKKTRHVRLDIPDAWYCFKCGYVRVIKKPVEKVPGPPKKPSKEKI